MCGIDASNAITDCFQALSEEEHAVVDRLIERGPTLCGVLDKRIVERLLLMCE